jgi:hypothetical protein
MSTKLSATASANSFQVRDPNYAERIKSAFGRQGFLRHVDARIEELAPGRCVIVASAPSSRNRTAIFTAA